MNCNPWTDACERAYQASHNGPGPRLLVVALAGLFVLSFLLWMTMGTSNDSPAGSQGNFGD